MTKVNIFFSFPNKNVGGKPISIHIDVLDNP